MTAESLLITYIQIGVAISGFSCIARLPREPRAGRVVIPRAPAAICPAPDKRRVHYSQRLAPDPGLHWARRADRVVLHQRLLRSPATRAYGDPGAERRPRRRHARPRAVGDRGGVHRQRGVHGGAAGELRLARCRLAASGHAHVVSRPVLPRLRAASPTRGQALRPRPYGDSRKGIRNIVYSGEMTLIFNQAQS